MNVPDRYAQLVDATGQDRARLTRLDEEITLRAHILNEGPAGLQALQDQRQALALDVEVSEAMLGHAQRTYELPAPGPGQLSPPAGSDTAVELAHLLNGTRQQRTAPAEGEAGHA